jgi:hypothetical protein
MKTITGDELNKKVDEGWIRIVLYTGMIGTRGYELPLDQLTRKSLVEIGEKVSGPEVVEIKVQVCDRSTPFEFSYQCAEWPGSLVSAIRIALIIAIRKASNEHLSGVHDVLTTALDRAYK